MGRDSKIEWTHHTFNPWSRLAVLQFVARLAERNAVRDVESQFGVFGKGLDVMGVEIPAASIAAPLAGKVVTAEHIEAPSLVLHREALVTALRQLTVFVRVAFLTAGRSLTRGGAYLPSCFDGMRNTQALGWLTHPCLRHLLFGFVGVAHPLERGHSATERRVGIIGSAARFADRGESISTAPVDMKTVTFDPTAASVAPLKALLNSLLVFLYGYADSFCSDLHCACFASHVSS